MRVQLIVPALEGFKYTRKSGCPPLGLASIATYLDRQTGDGDRVEILDGEMIGSNTEITARISEGGLVGILTKTPNYPGAVRVAQAAKAKGCTVVMGGVYATQMAQAIIQYRRGTVDCVVRGFGEQPMLRILELIQTGKRLPEERVISEGSTFVFDELGHASRCWFDMESYIANFSADRPTWGRLRGTNIWTHSGCVHHCSFCSRLWPLGGIYWRSPQAIWNEISELVAAYRVDYVIDFSDTLTQNPHWLRQLVEARPKALRHVRWHVFSTAGLLPKTIELLKQLNVVHVFVGVETGDEQVARNVLKGRNFSPGLVREGLIQLVKAGMRATPSFVYGLRGETEASMERTYQFARELVALTGAEEVFASEEIPWPGAPDWKLIKRRFAGTDVVEVETLKRAWLREVVRLDPKLVREYVSATLALARYPISVQGEGTPWSVSG